MATRNDPYTTARYLVELGGIVEGGFSEVGGLQVELETTDYREGGENAFVHRLPGPARYPSNLVLKRGLTRSEALWNWHRMATLGLVVRRNLSVVLLDADGSEAWRWTFQGAYPVRWEGPDLRAGQAEVAVETLELAHEGLSLFGTSGAA